MDKTAHKLYMLKHFRSMPDLIIHVPGTNKNLVVIEVKYAGLPPSKIMKDLNKIKRMINDIKYQYGILLLFGKLRESTAKKLEEKVYAEKLENNVFIINHAKSRNMMRIIFPKNYQARFNY